MTNRNPHLIVPEGTKIVTRAEVRGHDGRVNGFLVRARRSMVGKI